MTAYGDPTPQTDRADRADRHRPAAAPDGVGPPVHGGTDTGPPPRYDFSTNANALGPSPMALAALRDADPARYPEPSYAALREVLADLHHRTPDEVVVGAGGCELIHRAVRVAGGPVVIWEPTFGEYRYAAEVAGLPVRTAHDRDSWLEHLPGAALAVLCHPNSPDGRTVDLAPLAAAASAAGCRLLLDLAYHPLSRHRPDPPVAAWQLWAPNKAHAVTGVRAAYLLADRDDATRLRRAPSWVLSTHGEAFLAATATPQAQRWVARTRETLWAWQEHLTARLRSRGIEVTAGPANFVLAHVGDAAQVAARLRRHGIATRDATSFGLPGSLRLSAQPPEATAALMTALDRVRNGAPGRAVPDDTDIPTGGAARSSCPDPSSKEQAP